MIIVIMYGILSENGPNDANNAEQISVVWMKKRENRKFVLNKSHMFYTAPTTIRTKKAKRRDNIPFWEPSLLLL